MLPSRGTSMRLVTFRDPAGRRRAGDWTAEDRRPRGELDDRVARRRGRSRRGRWRPGRPSCSRPCPARRAFVTSLPSRATWRPAGAGAGERSRRPGTRRPSSTSRTPRPSRGRGRPSSGPAATRMLDFELEIAAVIGSGGEIAGFTLMNDWSARDVQAQEMTVGPRPRQGQGLRHFARARGSSRRTSCRSSTDASRSRRR